MGDRTADAELGGLWLVEEPQPPAAAPRPRGRRAPAITAAALEQAIVPSTVTVERRGWRRVVQAASGGRLDPGPSRADREWEALLSRCTPPLPDARRIVVASRKGGVGKTTNTVMLGHTFAALRSDRVIAIDADPDAGNLVHRVERQTRRHVCDLLDNLRQARSYTAVRPFTSQAPSRLEVLASAADPHTSRALRAYDYHRVVRALEDHYNLLLIDTGTGVIDNATQGLLAAADQLVLVLGPSIDEARAASMTFDWLGEQGADRLVADAVAVVNLTGPAPRVPLEAIVDHFAQRCRAVHVIGFDRHLQAGGVTDPDRLLPATQEAYVRLAADVGDGFGLPSARQVTR